MIVNWNAGEFLAQCLGSLLAADCSGVRIARIVIIDNASTDGSMEGLAGLDGRIRLVVNTTNLGFAAACNLGAADSSADYLLFLNPDTRLFRESLSLPVTFMEQPRNAGIGICGIQLLDDRGLPARSCARFPTTRSLIHHMLGLDRLLPNGFPSHFMADWDHATSRCVDHVIGAFFLVRRTLFERLGGFDERFFLYWEDLDFSLMAHGLGYRSYFLAEAGAYHKGGGTSGRIRARRLFYSLRSRLLFSGKHFGRLDRMLVAVGTFCVEPLVRLGHALLRGSPRQFVETLSGYGMLYAGAFKSRKMK
ncbi:MAG: glycosyltransferase family 2 protein [Sulfurisoma sp.]|nr:glycosyltransferase family 2 protein [Sulfurisoma sp.]